MNKLIPRFLHSGKNRLRTAAAVLACATIACTVVMFVSQRADEYVTASSALTQRYGGVTSEKMLLDFCIQLQTVRGITGVSYRDYNPATKSVTLTVYYNPRLASPRQLKIFLDHSTILWMPPRSI